MNSIQTFFQSIRNGRIPEIFGNTGVRSGVSIFIYADRFRSAA